MSQDKAQKKVIEISIGYYGATVTEKPPKTDYDPNPEPAVLHKKDGVIKGPMKHYMRLAEEHGLTLAETMAALPRAGVDIEVGNVNRATYNSAKVRVSIEVKMPTFDPSHEPTHTYLQDLAKSMVKKVLRETCEMRDEMAQE